MPYVSVLDQFWRRRVRHGDHGIRDVAYARTEFPRALVRVVIEPRPAVRHAVDGHAAKGVLGAADCGCGCGAGACARVATSTAMHVACPPAEKGLLLEHEMTIHTPRSPIRAAGHRDAVVPDEARVGARRAPDTGGR